MKSCFSSFSARANSIQVQQNQLLLLIRVSASDQSEVSGPVFPGLDLIFNSKVSDVLPIQLSSMHSDHRIIKVGKDYQDNLVQPSTHGHHAYHGRYLAVSFTVSSLSNLVGQVCFRKSPTVCRTTSEHPWRKRREALDHPGEVKGA